jgi:hypothetical protein
MKSLTVELAAALGHPLLEVGAAYFWLRGLWRNNRTDRALGFSLLIGLGIFGIAFEQPSIGFHPAGIFFLLLGLATFIVSPIVQWRGRSTAFASAASYLMLLAGALLSLLV